MIELTVRSGTTVALQGPRYIFGAPPIQLTRRISPALTLRRKALTMSGSSTKTEPITITTMSNGFMSINLPDRKLQRKNSRVLPLRDRHALVGRIDFLHEQDLSNANGERLLLLDHLGAKLYDTPVTHYAYHATPV